MIYFASNETPSVFFLGLGRRGGVSYQLVQGKISFFCFPVKEIPLNSSHPSPYLPPPPASASLPPPASRPSPYRQRWSRVDAAYLGFKVIYVWPSGFEPWFGTLLARLLPSGLWRVLTCTTPGWCFDSLLPESCFSSCGSGGKFCHVLSSPHGGGMWGRVVNAHHCLEEGRGVALRPPGKRIVLYSWVFDSCGFDSRLKSKVYLMGCCPIAL